MGQGEWEAIALIQKQDRDTDNPETVARATIRPNTELGTNIPLLRFAHLGHGRLRDGES
jgi:hypothetical protein